MLRGSVLPRILPALTINILIATLVTISHGDLFELKITLTTIPFTLIGLPISIFLGFRNNTAYDRFWEARKLWGELLIRSRNLSRQCQSLIAYPITAVASNGLTDIRVRMIYRAIAFSTPKNLLRDLPGEDMPQWLTQEEVTLMQSSKTNPIF
jgi:putative membrane protein